MWQMWVTEYATIQYYGVPAGIRQASRKVEQFGEGCCLLVPLNVRSLAFALSSMFFCGCTDVLVQYWCTFCAKVATYHAEMQSCGLGFWLSCRAVGSACHCDVACDGVDTVETTGPRFLTGWVNTCYHTTIFWYILGNKHPLARNFRVPRYQGFDS